MSLSPIIVWASQSQKKVPVLERTTGAEVTVICSNFPILVLLYLSSTVNKAFSGMLSLVNKPHKVWTESHTE